MEPMGQQVTTTEEQARKAGPGGMAIPPAIQPNLADQRLQRLVEQTVEQDVIPRLLLTRRDDAAVPTVAPAITVPSGTPVSTPLRTECLRSAGCRAGQPRTRAGGGEIHRLRRGAARGRLHGRDPLFGLAGADRASARPNVGGRRLRLHRCHGGTVPVAEQPARTRRDSYRDNAALNPAAPRILLVPLPREQHTFGLSMVYDFFRRAGWNAWSGTIESESELAGMVRELLVRHRRFLAAMRRTTGRRARHDPHGPRRIDATRRWPVMVGGPGFTANPDLAGDDRSRRHRHGWPSGSQGGRCSLLAQATARQCS